MRIKPFDSAGGYTTFDNLVLDFVMRECKPNTWKIVCVTIRQTIGWNKESDQISFTQYLEKSGIASKSTLLQAINDALDKGYIKRTPYKNSFKYSLNKDYEIDIGTETVPIDTDEENKTVQKQDQKRYRNRTVIGTETVPTKERNKKENIPDELNHDVFLLVWEEWKEYRKESKKPLKPTTIKRQLARLKKYKPEIAAAMLVQSIEHQWQGIFELKDKPDGGRKVKVNQDGSFYG